MNFSRLNAILDWCCRAGTLFGVPIRLHITLVFFLWAVLARSGMGFLYGVEYAVLIVLCILMHELGHALSAKHYGMSDLSIMLHGFGGFATSRGFRTPKQALVITLAGPAVTFAIGISALFIGKAGVGASSFGTEAYRQFYIIVFLGSFNILMGFLNLIPMLPFDGGNAFVAILSRRLPEFKARRAVAHIGLILAPIVTISGFATSRGLIEIFGLMGIMASVMFLLNTGGIKFGEAAADRRSRKDEEARLQRERAKNDAYLGDVAARAREREEQERLRKLLGQ